MPIPISLYKCLNFLTWYTLSHAKSNMIPRTLFRNNASWQMWPEFRCYLLNSHKSYCLTRWHNMESIGLYTENTNHLLGFLCVGMAGGDVMSLHSIRVSLCAVMASLGAASRSGRAPFIFMLKLVHRLMNTLLLQDCTLLFLLVFGTNATLKVTNCLTKFDNSYFLTKSDIQAHHLCNEDS
jgi:hypothetical protein